MKYIRSFLRFWYDFIIGDDWTIAAGVAIALASTAFLAHSHIVGWLWMPLAVVVLVATSLWRAANEESRTG